MTRAQLSRTIRKNWHAITRRSRVDTDPRLPSGPLRILGSSTKTVKGEGRGILTGVVYLAPAASSGRNLCPNSTPSCRSGCLGEHAGRMGFDPNVKNAQQWKTALRFGDPASYFALLRLDLAALAAKAARLGFLPAVRLDGTSDLGDAETIAGEFPGISSYEYTKSLARAKRWLLRDDLHATLSFSGENLWDCLFFLGLGGNVAVPFDTAKGEAFPESWHGYPTLDGDKDDYRADDSAGHVVALSWKGPKSTRDAARLDGWLQPA